MLITLLVALVALAVVAVVQAVGLVVGPIVLTWGDGDDVEPPEDFEAANPVGFERYDTGEEDVEFPDEVV